MNPQGLQCSVQATKHDHILVLTEACWPLPLYLFRQGIQWLVKSNYWYLTRIQVVDCTFDYTQGVLGHCHHVGRFKERWKKSSRTDDMTFWLMTCMVCCPRYIFQSLRFTFQDSLNVITSAIAILPVATRLYSCFFQVIIICYSCYYIFSHGVLMLTY